MTMREFWRYHSFKLILGLVVLQLIFFSWLQYRNHRPEAITDEYAVYEGHSVNCQPLRNDSDKDEEDELKLENVDQPQQGEIEIDGDKLVYLAKTGFAGVDSFAYTISDGKKKSKKAFIKITVDENLKPIAQRDIAQLYEGQEISLLPLGNDEDRERDSIFITDYTKPLHGELTKIDDKFIYKPTNPQARLDSFQYSISDGFSASEKASVVLTINSKSSACYPWISSDIGNPSQKGSLSCSGKKYEIKASGNDIWDSFDNFHFAYQQVSGNCEIVTKVTHLDNVNPYSKAGLMIRETPTGNSRNVFVTITPENGVLFQVRANTGSGSETLNNATELKAPYWLKLTRNGDEFKAFASSNGSNWAEMGTTTMELPSDVYIGLAVTSHDDGNIAKANFENVKTKFK